MSEECEEKRFTVTDKRSATRTTESESPETKETTQKDGDVEEKKTKGERLRERIFRRQKEGAREEDPAPRGGKDGLPPEIDFSSFILSLSSSVFIHLGEVPDPISNKKEKNLPMAKQTIDILEMLKGKTTGNLTLEEENLVESMLYDLRMRYLQEIRP